MTLLLKELILIKKELDLDKLRVSRDYKLKNSKIKFII